MGIVYSLTNTVYAYFYPPLTPITPQKICLHSKKLSFGLQQRLNALKKANFKLQSEFIELINKQKRDKYVENVKIDHLIMSSINYGVIQELIGCSKRIEHEAGLISMDMTNVSNECLKAIFALVHLYKDFELDALIDLKEFIPEPYPIIGIDKVQPQIRRFLEYKQPTEYERNVYVLEMVKRHEGKLSIFQLNLGNHNFSQNPLMDLGNHELNSNQLYARSASYQVEEEKDETNNNQEMQEYAL